jgi:IS5 family transposase
LLDVESTAGHLLKPGSVFGWLARHRRELFPDEMFVDLFASGRGRPSVPADVMATVITLQALHGLSEVETVDAVTYDLRWKAACGLAVTAAAFHSTTLTYWRRRLAESKAPNRIFTAVQQVIAETGVLRGRTRRALDSTVLDDAVATQDTVTQLIAAIRRVRREVPGAAAVIAEHCTAHDYDDAGKPAIAWDDAAAREALVSALVTDALRILDALVAQTTDPAGGQALALLALIAGQDVEPAEGSDGTDGRWRIARKVAADRVISVVDPDARHAHKTRTHHQDGFKAHVAVEPDTGLFTGGRLTKASGPGTSDGQLVADLLAQEHAPVDVVADSGYGSAEARATLIQGGHRAFIKPIPVPQVIPDGFTYDDFDVNLHTGTATCPAGHTRRIPASRRINFAKHCRACPVRARCTTSPHGRWITVHARDDLLRAARQQAQTTQFQQIYQQHRPMVERGIAWLVQHGNRRVRYRGVTKNNSWLHHRLAALNLRRLVALGLGRQDNTWVLA